MISKSLINRIFDSIQEFSIQKYSQPLGVGSFGTVRLGVHKYTNKNYAIKIICIDKNFKQNQLCLLQRQISIHYNLNHPHIVKLWDVIQENDRIYMIMQFAQKGNLFNFQSNFQTFTQAEAFKIFMQIIDALDYLHKNNIFHRDIKPQNILLDHELNTKLCDFGWAAPEILRKRSTFCGTYEYMAPEMINEQQYDFKIDIWALGVLLFQMIHAAAPFPAQNLQKMKSKISAGSYEINVVISAQLKSLLISILQFDPKDRPSIQQIKSHPWIQKMKVKAQQKNTQNMFDKKRTKNIYKSLDFTPPKKHASKFGSLLFQDVQVKRQKFVPVQMKSKLQKKKCRTLQEQSIQNMAKPAKNMLTLYNQKQNDDSTEAYLNKLMKVKDRLKIQNKITLFKNDSAHKNSKLNLNRINNYFSEEPTSGFKNFRSQDKIDRNQLLSTNRNLQTADVKKKKRRLQ